MSKFSITRAKGVGITFANGWTVSVQWGPGNYCANYVLNGPARLAWDAPEKAAAAGNDWDSPDAECAVIGPGGEFVRAPGWNDDVNPRMSADEVAQLIAWVSTQPAKASAA
jgi:hypothetical protein